MARAKGINSKFRAAFESQFGTAPASGYLELPFISSDLGAAQPFENDDGILGLGREPQVALKGDIDAGGQVVVPLDLRNIGFWLKGLLGAPATSGTDPYTHTFISGATSLPSIAGEVGHPDIPQYAMNAGLVVNQMNFSVSRDGGLPQATFDLIGKSESWSGSSGAGTPTSMAVTRFSRHQGSITRAASALGNIRNASLTFSNNIDAAKFLNDGAEISAIDVGAISYTGSLTARFADTTLLNDALGAAGVEIVLAYTIDSDNQLTITLHNVQIERPKIPVSGPGGVETTFNIHPARQSDGSESMTIVLKNDVAAY